MIKSVSLLLFVAVLVLQCVFVLGVPVKRQEEAATVEEAGHKQKDDDGEGPEATNDSDQGEESGSSGAAFPSGVYTNCKAANQFALTFDDGPYSYTSDLIDYLKGQGVVATFFINGNNYWAGQPDLVKPILKKAFDNGFEVASHTYTHPDLTTLSNDQIKQQMMDNEKIIFEAIGKYPAVVRPPYGSVTEDDVQLLNSFGYAVVNWSIDEQDWNNNPPLQQELDTLNAALNTPTSQGYISLEHDVYEQTAKELAPKIVEAVKAKGLQFVSVSDCLGVPAYKETALA
ncbi:hypothetical protein BC940DRAFT_296066 [Gongronella butleri]|nr:hypothetical protein BC940DRAFT_296066 [Gongronella butleri]